MFWVLVPKVAPATSSMKSRKSLVQVCDTVGQHYRKIQSFSILSNHTVHAWAIHWIMVTKCLFLCLCFSIPNTELSLGTITGLKPNLAQSESPRVAEKPITHPACVHIPTPIPTCPPSLRDQRGLFTPRKPSWLLPGLFHSSQGGRAHLHRSKSCFVSKLEMRVLCHPKFGKQMMFQRQPFSRAHQGPPHRMLVS